MVKNVQEMKTSLQFTQKDAEDLKPIHVKLEGINKELDKISRDLASHSQKMEFLENQTRRNNIVRMESQNLTMKLGKENKLVFLTGDWNLNLINHHCHKAKSDFLDLSCTLGCFSHPLHVPLELRRTKLHRQITFSRTIHFVLQ